MIRLIKPGIDYWPNYVDAVRECKRAGNLIEQMNMSAHITNTVQENNVSKAMREFRALEQVNSLPRYTNPCDHFWLLNGQQLIGIGVTRHYLSNDLEKNGGHIQYLVRPSFSRRGWEAKLLSLLIKECGKRGIKTALITYPGSNTIAAEAAKMAGGRVFDQVEAVSGGVKTNIVRCLADTKIKIRTWREPGFKFRDIKRISGQEVCLQLAFTVPEDISYCPAYRFNILDSRTRGKVGYIDLRIGYDSEIFCSGNIGYSIQERHRGHGYAGKAAGLLAPLASAHHMRDLSITCNPDNLASAKTAESLGARYLELIKLPHTSGQYKQGDRFKRRYIWKLH